jgi:hypothetical protein
MENDAFWFIPNLPSAAAYSPEKFNLLEIQKEAVVEQPGLEQSRRPHQEGGTRHPLHLSSNAPWLLTRSAEETQNAICVCTFSEFRSQCWERVC